MKRGGASFKELRVEQRELRESIGSADEYIKVKLR